MLFLLMALTAVDVFGRYVLNRPLPGSLELTEIIMSMMIFAALPLVTSRGGHIAVDIADHLLPEGAKAWIDLLVSAACTVGLGVLTWRLAVKALQFARYGDSTATLLLPLHPLAWFMAFGVGLTAIVFVLRVVSPDIFRASPDRHSPAPKAEP